MNAQSASVGRIVHFFPNESENKQLPNNMPFAPGIVTQVFGNNMCNMTLFLANPGGDANRQEWSVMHKDDPNRGDSMFYWDWPARV